MEGPNECEAPKMAAAMRNLHVAESEMEQATRDLTKAEAEIEAATAHLREAEEEIREAKEAKPVEVMVKVDGRPHHVKAGTYLVSVFKTLVGVAADRELDIVEDDAFVPLADEREIHICGHEVFISHVRTGGSS